MLKIKLFILFSFVFINMPVFADPPQDKLPTSRDCAALLLPETRSQANPHVDLSLCDPLNARKSNLPHKV